MMHRWIGCHLHLASHARSAHVGSPSSHSQNIPCLISPFSKASKSGACARRITFIWAIRHTSHMDWLSTEFQKALLTARQVPSLSLSLQIYITSSVSGNSPSRSSEDIEKDVDIQTPASNKRTTAFGGLEGTEVLYGRPNVGAILEDTVRGSLGPVSVDVSGPKPLLHDVRKALSGGFASPMSALKGAPSVQLNVETFSL